MRDIVVYDSERLRTWAVCLTDDSETSSSSRWSLLYESIYIVNRRRLSSYIDRRHGSMVVRTVAVSRLALIHDWLIAVGAAWRQPKGETRPAARAE